MAKGNRGYTNRELEQKQNLHNITCFLLWIKTLSYFFHKSNSFKHFLPFFYPKCFGKQLLLCFISICKSFPRRAATRTTKFGIYHRFILIFGIKTFFSVLHRISRRKSFIAGQRKARWPESVMLRKIKIDI